LKTIHQVVDVAAPRSKVWSALTEPTDMSGWWSTKVESPASAVGAVSQWTFEDGFNPTMRITALTEERDLTWQCTGGHEPWQDNTFRFQLELLDDGRTRLRFWQEYAVELDDDAYGIYNFNWGYYLESLRLLCATGTGKPFQAGAAAETY
jgi:uncharacterized protein YndB with AHSA1/START domain